MIKINTKGRYAVRAMLELAYSKKRVSLKTLAKNQNLSVKYLGFIMINLQKKRLVISFKGNCGGYELAKNIQEISLGDILESAEGEMAINKCIKDKECCEKTDDCQARKIWKSLNTDFKKIVYKYNLSELMEI